MLTCSTVSFSAAGLKKKTLTKCCYWWDPSPIFGKEGTNKYFLFLNISKISISKYFYF